MSPQLRQLEEQALCLPAEDREMLAGTLLQSLEQAPLTEIDQTWIEEAERRYQSWRAGARQAIPGEQFLSDVRRELGWH